MRWRLSRLDGADQRVVKLMREAEVEQPAPASAKKHIQIEPAPERCDFLCQRLALYRDCLPLESVPRQCKDICLPMLLGAHQEHQGLITTKQLLHLLDLERLRARECGVIGELLFEPRLNDSEFVLGLGELFA
jgi:hypothetical protein